MCSYQQLYYDDRIGYVLRCPQCRNLQIVFGNIMLTFEEHVLSEFHGVLETISRDFRDDLNDTVRQIQVPMPYVGISLLLSKRELYGFITMLDSAHTELQSVSILELFDKAG